MLITLSVIGGIFAVIAAWVGARSARETPSREMLPAPVAQSPPVTADKPKPSITVLEPPAAIPPAPPIAPAASPLAITRHSDDETPQAVEPAALTPSLAGREPVAAIEREEKAAAEAARRLADEKEKALRLANELEARRIREETEAAREEAARKAEERKLAAEAARKRQLARSREVTQALHVFLARGYRQPKEVQGAFLAFDATLDPEPMSLARLASVGALEESVTGMERLAWVASDSQNDRPRWNLGYGNSSGNWTPEARAMLRRTQKLLVDLGPALVEEGLLAP